MKWNKKDRICLVFVSATDSLPIFTNPVQSTQGNMISKDKDPVFLGILRRELIAPTRNKGLAARRTPAVRCKSCGLKGHEKASCTVLRHRNRGVWRPKSQPKSADTHSSAPSLSVPSSAPALTTSTIAMANYPLNVVPYLPPGMTIELGLADRKVRDDMVVSAIPPLRHDFLAIAEANRFIPHH